MFNKKYITYFIEMKQKTQSQIHVQHNYVDKITMLQ